jgi:hypothetical protein
MFCSISNPAEGFSTWSTWHSTCRKLSHSEERLARLRLADWPRIKKYVGFNPIEKEKRRWHWNFIGVAAARFLGA